MAKEARRARIGAAAPKTERAKASKKPNQAKKRQRQPRVMRGLAPIVARKGEAPTGRAPVSQNPPSRNPKKMHPGTFLLSVQLPVTHPDPVQ